MTVMSRDERNVIVSVRNLDTIGPKQAKRLEVRIASAVKSVRNSHDVRGVAAQARYLECRAAAIDGARVQTERIMTAARQTSSPTIARK